MILGLALRLVEVFSSLLTIVKQSSPSRMSKSFSLEDFDCKTRVGSFNDESLNNGNIELESFESIVEL